MKKTTDSFDTQQYYGDAIRKTVSNNLRSLLSTHHITQNALHQAIVDSSPTGKPGISSRALKNYLAVEPTKSSNNPSINSLQEVVRGLRYMGLDVDESFILRRHPNQLTNEQHTTQTDKAILKRHIAALIKLLKQLTPDNILVDQSLRSDTSYNATLIDTVLSYVEQTFGDNLSIATIEIVLDLLAEGDHDEEQTSRHQQYEIV